MAFRKRRRFQPRHPAYPAYDSSPEPTGPTQYRITGDAQHLRPIVPAPKNDAARVSLAFYSSPESLAQHVADTPQSSCWYHSAWTNSEKFAGSPDMESAIRMAREGWPEGAERAASLRDKVSVSVPVERRARTFAVAGAFPNVQRAIAGDPANMYRLDSVASRRRPVLTLLSDMCVPATTFAGCLTNRAAVVAAIVDAIESAGFACNIVGYCSAKLNRVRWATIVNLKDSDQPADIGRLAFGLGHASMFRRLAWVPAVEDRFTQAVGVALGAPVALDESSVGEFTYVLPAPTDDFGTEERAASRGLNALVEALQRQGCPAFPAMPDAA